MTPPDANRHGLVVTYDSLECAAHCAERPGQSKHLIELVGALDAQPIDETFNPLLAQQARDDCGQLPLCKILVDFAISTVAYFTIGFSIAYRRPGTCSARIPRSGARKTCATNAFVKVAIQGFVAAEDLVYGSWRCVGIARDAVCVFI